MESVSPVSVRGDLSRRFAAFIAERHPFALAPLSRRSSGLPEGPRRDPAAIEALRAPLAETLRRQLRRRLPEASRGNARRLRREAARAGARGAPAACDGFLAREAIAADLTREERLEILRGMVLTRATDNRLKAFFTGERGPLPRHAVPGEGIPVARAGGDLRGARSGCGAATASAARTAVEGRRRRAA